MELNTIFAASGSFLIFASAAGEALPWDRAFPPIRTISDIFLSISGFSISSCAIFVKGPIGTSVTSFGYSLILFLRNSIADCFDNFAWGFGKLLLPWPSFPCTTSPFPKYSVVNGLDAPVCTGMSSLLAISSMRNAFSAPCVFEVLP